MHSNYRLPRNISIESHACKSIHTLQNNFFTVTNKLQGIVLTSAKVVLATITYLIFL